MLPPGHLAFSYLIAKPFFRSRPGFPEVTSLTMGTLFPDIGTAVLKSVNVLDLASRWSHSPLILIPLLVVGLFAWRMRVPYGTIPILFALGVGSHLIVDILFDIPTLYLSDATDDIGGRWFYPWRLVNIEYEGRGFNIQPWELIMEGAFLALVLFMWAKTMLGKATERNPS